MSSYVEEPARKRLLEEAARIGREAKKEVIPWKLIPLERADVKPVPAVLQRREDAKAHKKWCLALIAQLS